MRLITLFLLGGTGHNHVPLNDDNLPLNNASAPDDVTSTGGDLPIDNPMWIVAAIDGGIIALFIITVGIIHLMNRIKRPWLPNQSFIASRKAWMDIGAPDRRPTTTAKTSKSSSSQSRRASPTESRRASPTDSRRSSPASRREIRSAARS